MRVDAVVLRRAAKVDLACFRKPRKKTASRVTALVLHGVVKATDEGTGEGAGGTSRRWRSGLKSPRSLKSALSFAGGDNGGSCRRTTGGTVVSCVFVPIYIKGALHKRRGAYARLADAARDAPNRRFGRPSRFSTQRSCCNLLANRTRVLRFFVNKT